MKARFFRQCGLLGAASLMLGVAWAAPGSAEVSPSEQPPTSQASEQDAGSVQPSRPVVESYDPQGRRDPFQPYARALDRAPVTGAISPLQQYELSQLRLVAVVTDQTDPDETRAVLEDSSGLGYIITVGTPIGRTNGRVTAIERDRIVVEEWPSNVFGERERVVVVKELDSGEEAMR